MCLRFVFCLLFSLLSVPTVNASQLHFQLENDVTFGEDGNYSNGMIFGWESKALSFDPADSVGAHNWLNLLIPTQHNAVQAWGLKVSQRMWTPDEIKIAEAQPYDRPYAGFLEFEQHASLYSSDIAQKTWLAIGIMGPASGTEQLQGAIHKVIGASTPLGWHHQIETPQPFNSLMKLIIYY